MELKNKRKNSHASKTERVSYNFLCSSRRGLQFANKVSESIAVNEVITDRKVSKNLEELEKGFLTTWSVPLHPSYKRRKKIWVGEKLYLI